jgi:AraC-like DNA-binding protein
VDKRERQYNLDLDFRIALGATQVNVLCINYEAPVPDWGYELHSHSSYELHFIPRGKGELRLGRERYAIGPGVLYLTGPGVFHEQRADRVDPMSEFCLNIEVLPHRLPTREMPARLVEEEGAMLAALRATTFWFGPDRFPSFSLFEEVFAEMEKGRLGSYARIQNLLALILINAIRNFAPQKETGELPRKDRHEARRFLIDRYFDQATSPSREELASLAGTSVRQLSRILAEYYGMSFIEKLNYARLQKAADLLQTSSHSVLEISEQLGFSGQGYFSARFRERYGCTPTRFRKSGG